MLEWLGIEWWREIWKPLLAGGLVWFATLWKTMSDNRASRDTRLDNRLDKELARADAESEALTKRLETAEERRGKSESEKDRIWFAARRMEEVAHRYRHDAHNIIMKMSIASGQPMPPALPEVPSLPSLLPKAE